MLTLASSPTLQLSSLVGLVRDIKVFILSVCFSGLMLGCKLRVNTLRWHAKPLWESIDSYHRGTQSSLFLDITDINNLIFIELISQKLNTVFYTIEFLYEIRDILLSGYHM